MHRFLAPILRDVDIGRILLPVDRFAVENILGIGRSRNPDRDHVSAGQCLRVLEEGIGELYLDQTVERPLGDDRAGRRREHVILLGQRLHLRVAAVEIVGHQRGVDFEIDPPVLFVAVVISPDADAHVELMLPVERIVDAVVAQRQRSDRILIGHVDRLPLEIVESDRLVRAGSQQRSGGGQCHNCFFHKLCDVLIVTILGSVRAPSSVRRRGSARRSYNP